MIVYHRTSHAEAIERNGFRDGKGAYMTDRLDWRGVWVADEPLEEQAGAHGDHVIALEIPEALFDENEWVEDGKSYRESLIPAKALNAHLRSARVLPEAEAEG